MSSKTASGHEIEGLVKHLTAKAGESTWFEFKHNNADPQRIGEYLSALSNCAAIAGEPYGFLVWGIRDTDHRVVGTTFAPEKAKKGGEDLTNWLKRGLSPSTWFEFSRGEASGHAVIVLEVKAAEASPVAFYNKRWVRVGQNLALLQNAVPQEQLLWKKLQSVEERFTPVLSSVKKSQLVELLDTDTYYRRLDRPLEHDLTRRIDSMESEEFIRRSHDGSFEIGRDGALLLARDLTNFPSLVSKTVRVLEYGGQTRTGSAISDFTEKRGYAVSFEELSKYIEQRIPRSELLESGLRKDQLAFPPLAVREILANALVHQDLSISGAGPTLEIFSDRLEISNPGPPLVDIDRLLDHPPRSRNEAIADFMFRIGVCEKRGSGIDKVVEQVENQHGPAPIFRSTENSMIATLFDAGTQRMSKQDRVRAIAFHAAFRYVQGSHVTNESVRERFGLDKSKSSAVSRYLNEAVEAGVISQFDPEAGKRSRSYVPSWA